VVGKKYEVVVTNKNGLWRYQLNDIVEVAGFTPEEGIPLLRYIERKGCAEKTLFDVLFWLASLILLV
jgi:GH3 auxin-responsive promoter